MVIAASKIINLLLIAYLITFPFGQLAAHFLFGYEIHLADLIVLMIAMVHYIRLKGRVFIFFNKFVIYLIFSYLFSLYIFDFRNILGLLYLGRLLIYILLFEAVLHQIQTNAIERKKVISLLIYFGTLTAILGILQYIFVPDLRFLHDLGWDRHHGRLVGLFLDPAFIGLILVLNILLTTKIYLLDKKPKILLLVFVNIFALLLTFSRASYLALIISFIILVKEKIKIKKVILIISVFLLSLNFLPKFHSEGTNLLRTYSITARFDDYKSAFKVISDSPVIGVGYNNLCEYKVRVNEDVLYSHTCSGFDSSILTLVASTGLIGAVLFIFSIIQVTQRVSKKERDILFASYLAVIVHSSFNNSMLYPWIMGWMFILIPTLMIKEKISQ